MLASSSLIAFVAATDLEQAKAFYCDTLGVKLVSESEFALELDAAGTMLRVTKVASFTAAPYTVLGWRTEDIEADLARLRSAGVSFEVYQGFGQTANGIWTAPSGARIVWFKDPEGNVLSLTQF